MANNLLYYKALVYKDAVHRPLGAEERLTVDSLPLSTFPGNLIRPFPDGLYVGQYYGRMVYYIDSVAGRDDPTGGDKLAPFRTLDYCMKLINDELTNGAYPFTFTVALKAGQTFPYTYSMPISGRFTLTWYGDPKYGDFDDPIVVGRMATYMPTDLKRPVVNIGFDPNNAGDGIAGWVLFATTDGSRTSITFSGIRVNLPTGNYTSGQGAVIVANQKSNSAVMLEGSVINANGDNSTYGLLAVLPSATVFMYQFGSQFRIDDIQIGAQPTPPPTAAQLQRRKWFIKMHPDFYPTMQTGYDPNMLESSPGTGLLNLSWSDAFTVTDVNGNTAQNTWPMLADATFGFGQYVNILHRDSQGRPLNVISGRLF